MRMGWRNICQNFVMFYDSMVPFNAAFSHKRTEFSLKIFDYRKSWSFYVVKINIRWKREKRKKKLIIFFRAFEKMQRKEKFDLKIRTGMQTFLSKYETSFLKSGNLLITQTQRIINWNVWKWLAGDAISKAAFMFVQAWHVILREFAIKTFDFMRNNFSPEAANKWTEIKSN